MSGQTRLIPHGALSPPPAGESPAAFIQHRVIFIGVAASLLALSLGGSTLNPLDAPVVTALIILVLGVPHGAFDVAIWSARCHGTGNGGRPLMLSCYVSLACGFMCLWIVAPAFAFPIFIALSMCHFAGDWERDLDVMPRLIVAGAIVSAPPALHRAEVVEIFSWITPQVTANSVALVMAVAAVPLLQASVVVIGLLALRRPWAAAELAVVLALAWLTPPLLFFLVYFCGLHSVRHMIETRRMLGGLSGREFVLAACPYAPLAIAGTLAGAVTLSTLPLGPALIGTVFMALGALTVPHMIIVDHVTAEDAKSS